jgi:Carboxypeptidase regulatory-like domain/TonB-dependent Receptor Plug Domain
MSNRVLSRVLFTLLALVCAPLAFAQNAGSLRGTVADNTGAVLPGANVVLTSESTKFAREGVTDARGGFYFATVDSGSYALKVTMQGFKTYELGSVRVSANDTVGVDVVLQVGAQTETINVTASREIIRTETGAREGVITPEQIENISILGRNPLELLRTLPGIVPPEQGQFEKQGIGAGFGQAGADAFSINGARAENLGVTLDGANLRDIGNNSGMLNVPNNEFVAEVKVQTSNYAAEFGTAAVNVQAVTKSGSSEFHGSLFDYLRDSKFAANERARNYAGQERPKDKFQYPGFTLSGPVLFPGTGFNKERDKAFFFFGWEWQRQTQAPDPIFDVVPTAAMRAGQFGNFGGGQNLDQGRTIRIPRGFPGAGSTIPNGDVSPYISPVGRAFLNLYPQPNYNDPNNRYNYIFNPLVQANRSQGVARVDYNVTDNTRAYVRVARDSEVNENARGLWWQPGGVELPTPIQGTAVGNSAVLNVTSVLSPTTTNEILFSWSRLKNDNRFQDPEAVSLDAIGAGALQNPFGGSGIIPDLVNEFGGAGGGRGSMWFAQDVDNIFSYNGFMRVGDNFTKVLNTHAIKIGGIAERQYKQQNFQHQNNIQLNFARWADGGTGNEFADMLIGRPASAVVGQPSAIGHFVAYNFEFYAQDSWKVKKNFTLEYGVRLGRWSNNAETESLGSVFLPELYDRSRGFLVGDNRANGFAYAATGQVENKLTDNRPLLVMPRVNYAWDLQGNGTTVIRGGGGIFFNRESGNAQYGIINIPPNSFAVELGAGTFQNVGGGQGLNYNTIGQINPLGNPSLITPGEIDSVNPNDLDWPRMYQVSTSIARRIPLNHTVEVGYVGTFGRNLTAKSNINVIQPGTLNTRFPDPIQRAALADNVVNSFRPFPAYGVLNYLQTKGVSNYHSLQATVSRQTGNFTYLLAYTLSKNKGTTVADFGRIDPIDQTRSEGTLPIDRTHYASFSWTWRLGDPAKGGAAAAVLNGWNLSGVSNYATGQPIRLGFSGDIAGDQAARAWWGTQDYANFDPTGGDNNPGDITPVFTCDPSAGAGNTGLGEKILNVSCIGIPAFGQTGELFTPYNLRTPSRNFHDITVFKDFKLGGDRRLQFRVGAFNVFNQAYPTFRPNRDFDLVLQTECNRRVSGVPNGNGGTADNLCDPTGGYHLSQNSVDNFGKVITKRGRRVVEFALRLFF